jgi:hypothetical protein
MPSSVWAPVLLNENSVNAERLSGNIKISLVKEDLRAAFS